MNKFNYKAGDRRAVFIDRSGGEFKSSYLTGSKKIRQIKMALPGTVHFLVGPSISAGNLVILECVDNGGPSEVIYWKEVVDGS